MPAPRSLNTNLLFLAGELTHLLHQKMTAGFRDNRISITVEQFAVLTVLFYENGVSQQELGMRLNRNKTTMTRVISNMERGKLIVRRIDQEDARGKHIHLTSKGKDVQQRAIAVAGALYMKTVESISQKALKSGADVLVKAIGNLK